MVYASIFPFAQSISLVVQMEIGSVTDLGSTASQPSPGPTHSLVADELPLGGRRPVNHEEPLLALHAARDRVLNERVLAGRVGALVASEARPHVGKWRVGVTVWT